MRRKLTMIALAAMMLAAGDPAPKLRIQPRINKAPARQPTIPASLAMQNIQVMIPGATVLKILPSSSGDFIATVRIENQVKKIRVDGETGAVQN